MIDEICSFSQSKLLTGNVSEIFLNVINQFHQQYQAVHGHLCIVLCLFDAQCQQHVLGNHRTDRYGSDGFVPCLRGTFCRSPTMLSFHLHVQLDLVPTMHALFSVVLHTISLWLAALFALVRLIVIRRTKIHISIPHALTFTVVQETVPCKEHSENASIRYTLMPSQLAIAATVSY
ncbi:Deoxyribonuclease-1 [Trichinella spiralis]|uniref:Deoxyribonuclease-1 n=1 Tax=Trichinella spiralis TaxID=6334 RepID=A0ABR3KSN9_TRISP